MTGIPSYVNRSTMTMQMLTQMRWQVDDLQRQLATGKRSDTYAGLGIGRTLDLEARMRLTRLEAFETSISTVNLRVNVMNTVLDRIRAAGQDNRSDVRFPIEYELTGGGQTNAQHLAYMRLDETLSLLNERVGDRYLFSGSATDTRPTANIQQILDGDGAAAGLKQVTAERLLADSGADGRGRLAEPLAAGTAVTLAEDGDHPFGMKLAAVTTSFGAADYADRRPARLFRDRSQWCEPGRRRERSGAAHPARRFVGECRSDRDDGKPAAGRPVSDRRR
jgi:flagellar hook-associated protein 3 FlgL